LREETFTCAGPAGNDSEATANAIHLILNAGAEVIVSHAHSDIWCCCPKEQRVECCKFGQVAPFCSSSCVDCAAVGGFCIVGATCVTSPDGTGFCQQ
jgi:hypothetical protein